jgi:hypothetical protein
MGRFLSVVLACDGIHMDADAHDLERLRADFQGWRFLVSDRRRWWALRGPLPMDKLHEADAFDADSSQELRAALLRHRGRQ